MEEKRRMSDSEEAGPEGGGVMGKPEGRIPPWLFSFRAEGKKTALFS